MNIALRAPFDSEDLERPGACARSCRVIDPTSTRRPPVHRRGGASVRTAEPPGGRVPVLRRRPRSTRAVRRARVRQPVAVDARRSLRGRAVHAASTTPASPRSASTARRRVVDLWAERSAALGARDDVAYVLVFENRGAEVGATIPHPHGQIYAFDAVPPTPARPSCDRRRPIARARGGRPASSRQSSAAWRAWVPRASTWPIDLRRRAAT